MARPPQDDVDQAEAPQWISPAIWLTYFAAGVLLILAYVR